MKRRAFAAQTRDLVTRVAACAAACATACAAACAAFLLPAALAAAQDNAGEPVTLAIVGDVMLADGPGKSIARGRDPLAPFGKILAEADIRVANLECVIASRGKAEDKPFTFLAHPRTMAVVKRHFDAVSVANNHSGDFGAAAFAEMLDRLRTAKVGAFGGGRDLAEAHAPLIIERKGLRIALLGYNEFFPRSFEADIDKPGIAWSEDEQVRRDIIQAREVHGADLVIPFMHWGIEHEPLADARQRALARLMIDAGADAVIGGHPHVTQDVESYRGKPIVYSLGNFVFDSFTDVDNNTGWLLRLELDRHGVRSWNTVIARMDGQGTPHPRPDLPAQCWDRETAEARACTAQVPR